MKRVLFALVMLILSATASAAIPNLVRLDTSQTNSFAPAAMITKYMVYCNAAGVASGMFLPAEVQFETPVTTTAVISYYDGVIGSTGVHRFNATLTYTDGTRTTLSISGCPIIQ